MTLNFDFFAAIWVKMTYVPICYEICLETVAYFCKNRAASVCASRTMLSMTQYSLG